MAPGVLIQIPHKFFAREAATLGFTLPAPGEYGIGMVFLPVETASAAADRRNHRAHRQGRRV